MHSLATRQKLSDIAREQWKTKSRRAARTNKGFRHTEETKSILRKRQTGKKNSAATRQKMSLALRGRILSEEDKRRKSASQRIHAELPLQGVCGCFAHRPPPKAETQIERFLVGVLLAEFPEIQAQKQFGCYCVDAYLPPPYHLAFEADGTYWHQHPKRDAVRDQYLSERFGLPVIRLSELELNEMSDRLGGAASSSAVVD